MSVVTNVILSANLHPGELDALNASLSRCYWAGQDGAWAGGRKFQPIQSEWIAGTKCLETDILIAAFSHLVLKELVAVIESVEWEWPEDVQLLVKGNEEPRFREVPLKVRKKERS